MMNFDTLVGNGNYFFVIVLLMMGLWAMLSKSNLLKKCIGMGIFQTAIILFYISMGAKEGATIPILEHHTGGHGADIAHHVIASHYANPLTQILMLTAIVVGVATLGVALSLVLKIYRTYGTIEDDVLRSREEL